MMDARLDVSVVVEQVDNGAPGLVNPKPSPIACEATLKAIRRLSGIVFYVCRRGVFFSWHSESQTKLKFFGAPAGQITVLKRKISLIGSTTGASSVFAPSLGVVNRWWACSQIDRLVAKGFRVVVSSRAFAGTGQPSLIPGQAPLL